MFLIQFPISSADLPDVNEYWYFVGIDLKNLLKGISFFDFDGGTITNVGAVDKPNFWNASRLFVKSAFIMNTSISPTNNADLSSERLMFSLCSSMILANSWIDGFNCSQGWQLALDNAVNTTKQKYGRGPRVINFCLFRHFQ